MTVLTPRKSLEGGSTISVGRIRLLERNIIVLFFVRSFRFALVGESLFVRFWNDDIHIENDKIIILQQLASIMVISLEIPSGFVSDRLGRKRTLVLSAATNAAGFAMYAVSRSFVHCLAAELLLAVGSSLWSGTDAALLYETLHELGREREALSKESVTTFFVQLAESFSAVLGGYVANGLGGPRSSMLVTVIPFAMALILIILLTIEASQPPLPGQTRGAQETPTAFVEVLRGIKSDLSPSSELFIPFFTIAFTLTGCFACTLLCQMLWQLEEVSPVFLGWAGGAMNLFVCLGSLVANILQAKLGIDGTILAMSAVTFLGFVVIGCLTTPVSVAIAGCAVMTLKGVSNPVITTFINERVQSDRRVTMLSILSLSMRALFSIFGSVLAWVTSVFSVQASCVLSGIVIGGTCAAAVLIAKRVRKPRSASYQLLPLRGDDDAQQALSLRDFNEREQSTRNKENLSLQSFDRKRALNSSPSLNQVAADP